MNLFYPLTQEIFDLINQWEPTLQSLPDLLITKKRNSQNRTIKQILGHLIDSASNNIHRIVHFQYQESPINFPDYAHFGNNDKWIAIQNYQDENWNDIISLWKYSNIHLIHVIRNIDSSNLDKIWIAATKEKIPMRNMVTDYPRHLKLHLNEIKELIEL
jgi:hypothetical protein